MSATLRCFPGGSDSRVFLQWGRPGFDPWVRKIPREKEMVNPLQYSCLENSMDGGAWRAIVCGVAKSRTWLSDFTFLFPFQLCFSENVSKLLCFHWSVFDFQRFRCPRVSGSSTTSYAVHRRVRGEEGFCSSSGWRCLKLQGDWLLPEWTLSTGERRERRASRSVATVLLQFTAPRNMSLHGLPPETPHLAKWVHLPSHSSRLALKPWHLHKPCACPHPSLPCILLPWAPLL